MKLHLVPVLSALLLGLSASPSHAQATSGTIVGEAVAGDTIFVRNEDIGFKREIKIKDSGRYQVRKVPLGSYTVVKVHADGSIEPAKSVLVQVGTSARVMDDGTVPVQTGVESKATSP